MLPIEQVAESNQDNLSKGIPPVIYDDANPDGVLTVRLIAMMKKQMQVLGDVPKILAVDGAQFFDLPGDEDFPVGDLGELKLTWTLIPRLVVSVQNRFCVMVGEAGKVVIGAYPVSTPETR
jgi:hypothetical protein